MRFIAFDSFEGLPEPEGIDVRDGFTSNFHKNDFSYTKESFIDNLKRARIDIRKTIIVKGWFNKTLTRHNAQKYRIKQIAVAWIDCDLYKSALPVLKFITPYLISGSVIVFDDWHCYRNHPQRGVQLACQQWLRKNKRIQLDELLTYGWNGKIFTVRNH